MRLYVLFFVLLLVSCTSESFLSGSGESETVNNNSLTYTGGGNQFTSAYNITINQDYVRITNITRVSGETATYAYLMLADGTIITNGTWTGDVFTLATPFETRLGDQLLVGCGIVGSAGNEVHYFKTSVSFPISGAQTPDINWTGSVFKNGGGAWTPQTTGWCVESITTDTYTPSTYFFLEDFETGSLNTSKFTGSNLAINTSSPYEGTYSMSLSYSNDVTCDNKINSGDFTIAEYSRPYCLDIQGWYTSNTANNLEQGLIFDAWATGIMFDSNPGAASANLTFVDNSNWFSFGQNFGDATWGYTKVCFTDGYASSGTTTAILFDKNGVNTLNQSTMPRSMLDNICFHNRESASSVTKYDMIRIWDYEEHGSEAPQDVQTSNPNATVRVLNSFDNSSIENINVTLGYTINTTNSTGYAFFDNTTIYNYTVDGGLLYTNTTGTATENDTVTAYISLKGYSLCTNITEIQFHPNLTLGTYNISADLYTEPDITAKNSSICGYTYLLNTTNKGATTYVFESNITSTNATLKINGTILNATQNVTINVTNNTQQYVNVTLNYTTVAVRAISLPFTLEVYS